MKTLTARQSKILFHVEILRDLWIKEFNARKEEFQAMCPDKPVSASEWVDVVKLGKLFQGSLTRDLEVLVKAGYLEKRPTDGWGEEVKLARKEN